MTRLMILGSGDFTLALALLLGDPLRTSSPSFHVIKQTAPIHVWAAVLLIIGVLLLALIAWRDNVTPQMHWRLVWGAACAGAMWGAFWCVALLEAAVRDQHASLTGPVTYLAFFTIPHLMLAFGREG